MPGNILAEKDVNTHTVQQMDGAAGDSKSDIKSMEYHRQVLQNMMGQEQYATFLSHCKGLAADFLIDRGEQTYVSPSDGIMSPCTAKLNAYRNKQVGKYVTS